MLSAIAKWFSAGSDSAEKVLDAGIRGIDALVLTEEERLNAHKELAANWIKLQEVLGEETSIRSLTRRWLSILILGTYTLLTIGSAVVWTFWVEYANFLWELANGQFAYMSLAVAAFYFGPEMLSRIFVRK